MMMHGSMSPSRLDLLEQEVNQLAAQQITVHGQGGGYPQPARGPPQFDMTGSQFGPMQQYGSAASVSIEHHHKVYAMYL
eukprot:CAMPEP_0176102436 /NCGR_PEP_ID=MMETSP0120_2-20121206/51382_1 /TAXON_ID=160619 /ORGANISM="Kryptoperidinium foliaceum, Strain CCMP 1326" /LENGTH=78 /DNA_ID=CAMNT_0017436497 /DNA_START=1 /DNA_END=233 /DNA_ORIENTATION=+